MVNKAVTRTVMPSLSDAMSLDGMGPYPGGYRSAGGPGREYPTATVPRNYQYTPASEAYSSLSRGVHMDPRHR